MVSKGKQSNPSKPPPLFVEPDELRGVLGPFSFYLVDVVGLGEQELKL